MENEVVIMSMNLDAVRRVRNTAPEMTVGYVSAFSLGSVGRLPVGLLAVHRRSITPRLLRQAQQAKMEVYAWTVNRAAGMATMIELGADGIITDDPGLGVRVRKEMRELTAAERLLLQVQQFVAGEE